MKNNKAFVNSKGKIDTKEIASIEYFEEEYLEKLKKQEKKIKDMLAEFENEGKKNSD